MENNSEKELSESEQRQRALYDKIGAAYNEHYSDEWSNRYRDLFYHRELFEGIDLEGKKVLDAMCGVGDVTRYLLEKGAKVTGLDISAEQVDAYKDCWGTEGIAASILQSGIESDSFDVIVVCGGLHHLHPNLNGAVTELHRVLKPGGHFCFVEPHAHSVLEIPRKIWYSLDDYFEDNEAAIHVDQLTEDFAGKFVTQRNSYGGSFAYMLVLNSLIFRVPHWLKARYSPFTFWLERLVAKTGLRWVNLYVVGQWQKVGVSDD